jgi:transcriptional regulator with XRE-family HTH domain
MKEIAEHVGVSEGTISRWESGEIANMRRDKIMLLADALDISPALIMGWDLPEPITNGFSLSTDEKSLINTYRTLNDQGKQNVLDYAKFTAEKYSIDEYEPELLAAHARAGADPEDIQSDLDLVKRLTLNKKNH